MTITCVFLPVYELSTCPGWQVAKLVAHARFLKSTILIKIGDMFVKWILKGGKCDRST